MHPAKRQMFISNGHISFTGRGTLGGPTDGYIGVEPGQILKAKKGFDDYKDAHNEPKPKSYPNHVWFRFIEDRNPLLVIYSVRPDMKKLQDDNDVEMLKYMDRKQQKARNIKLTPPICVSFLNRQVKKTKNYEYSRKIQRAV